MVNRLTEIAYSCKLKHDNPNFDHFLEEIALTFEQVLERTSGVYRRNAKGVSLILGIITAVLFNIDSFYILDQLYKNPDLTQEINQLANSVVEENKLCLTEGGIEDVSNSLNDEQKAKKLECDTKSIEDIKQIEQLTEKQITLPLGWKKNDSIFLPSLQESQNGLFAIFGWLITAVAIAMGAPFWFDLLGKVINVRNAGKSIGLTKDSKP